MELSIGNENHSLHAILCVYGGFGKAKTITIINETQHAVQSSKKSLMSLLLIVLSWKQESTWQIICKVDSIQM